MMDDSKSRLSGPNRTGTFVWAVISSLMIFPWVTIMYVKRLAFLLLPTVLVIPLVSACSSESNDGASGATETVTTTKTTTVSSSVTSTREPVPFYPVDPGDYPYLLTEPLESIGLSDHAMEFLEQQPIFGEGYESFDSNEWRDLQKKRHEEGEKTQSPHFRTKVYDSDGIKVDVDYSSNLNNNPSYGIVYSLYRDGELISQSVRSGNDGLPKIFVTPETKRVFALDPTKTGPVCFGFTLDELVPGATVRWVEQAGAWGHMDDEGMVTQSGLGKADCYTHRPEQFREVGKMGSWQFTDQGVLKLS